MGAENRERGKTEMQKVYGWDIGDIGDDAANHFTRLTVDHLFGEIWAADGLSQRERRLLLIGIVVGLGEHDVVQLQVETAKKLGELDDPELRDIVRFVTHYAGWPRGAKLNNVIEALIAAGDA